MMNLFRKAILFYKHEGLLKTCKRVIEKCIEVIKRLPIRLKEMCIKGACLNKLAKQVKGKYVFILIPCIDWNIPLFQRPHQIAVELSKMENSMVLFVSDQYRYDCFAGCASISENLTLLSFRMMDKLDVALNEAAQVIVFMSWMRQAHLLKLFHYHKLIYEYIDDLSLFYYHTPQMEEEHQQLMAQADLTVCTASKLYTQALPYAKKAILSPNAGDYTFFYANRNCQINEMLRGKIEQYECIIGYYGCLASWFDYGLIKEIASKKPKWGFVMIGYCFDDSFHQLEKKRFPNIIHIPAQPYRLLPSFIAAFDIQCIPFVINEITNSTSPVKLFEYMASGKPILTSKMPECLKYQSVYTYENADDFIMQAQHLLSLKDNKEYLRCLDMEAKENTWTARVETILKNIEGM